MNITSERPDLFNLHDGPVRSIAFIGSSIELELEYGIIDREHSANPAGVAQTIRLCLLRFLKVSETELKIWDESTKSYMPHPEPDQPIRGDVIEYRATRCKDGYAIHIAGFHREGWVEWNFMCASVTVAWSEFAGKAWYEC